VLIKERQDKRTFICDKIKKTPQVIKESKSKQQENDRTMADNQYGFITGAQLLEVSFTIWRH
jgi:hypothetical protein